MSYSLRIATLKDKGEIAPLWRNFLEERAQEDISFNLKSDFDYEAYIQQQLKQPSTYGFLLQYGDKKELVGFLFVYVYDEQVPTEIEHTWETPFQPRRIGGAIGMYIKEQHRKPDGIKLLIEAAIAKAEELKVSDLDLLISASQTGIHKLLERFGFTKSAVQYTKHYQVTDKDLPPLKSFVTENIEVKMPTATMIPLRELKTKQPVLNPDGKQVFLHPLKNSSGKVLKSSNGIPIYPTPLIHPQTREWVFDEEGELVVCPVVLDEMGKVIEKNGLPQFQRPVYQRSEGKLALEKDSEGKYMFSPS